MKIQTKTTLLFTILTATIFLISSLTVYFFINEYAHRDFNKRLELRARLSAINKFEKDSLSTQAVSELQDQYLEKLPEEQAIILLIDPLSKQPVGQIPKPLNASFVTKVINADGNTVFYQSRFRHYAGLLYKHVSGNYLVIGSANNKYGSDMMRQLRIIKFVTFIGAVLLIYSVGLYFSKKAFQPIRHIINRVQEISQGNLHLRLKPREGSDEIGELTSTFNQMLNRLETAFEAQNNFISHASHELRTPLTAVIGEADYALAKVRTPEAYQYSLQQIAEQAEKLQTLSKGLLSLAQTGFNGKTQTLQSIRLDQLLCDVKADCDAILPNNHIQISVEALPQEEEDISIMGNYDLLKIAINNIVLNACKYSQNQPVSLRLEMERQTLSIVVEDKGIGIPEEELKYIYDPFFRASNTTSFEGYGIGMPLANNIVRLHNGRISVRSAVNVGTRVRVVLPVISHD
jgi:signal transduction histidine kinase